MTKTKTESIYDIKRKLNAMSHQTQTGMTKQQSSERLKEIAELFDKGEVSRVYVVTQDKNGVISACEFRSGAAADLSSPR